VNEDAAAGQPQLLNSLIPALLVLLTGFIALLTFWAFSPRSAALPGLFHYRSATWGDGLLLPVLTLSLLVLTSKLPKPRRTWPTWLARAGGAGAGLLLIITWLADPHPDLNWTIPRAHHFNAAGTWHAVFLIAASGFFAGAWVELLRRLRAADDSDRAAAGSPLLALALGCSVGYAWLAAADSSGASRTISGKGSLAALSVAFLILAGCLLWATHWSFAAVMRVGWGGLLVAVAAVMFVDAFGHAKQFMFACAVVGALGAGLALAGAPGRRVRFSSLELICVPAIFAIALLRAVHTTTFLPVFIAPLLAVAFSIFTRTLLSDTAKRWQAWLSVNYLAGAGISASLLAAGIFGLWLSEHHVKAYITGGFLLTLLGAILGATFLPYFKSDYESLMQAEGDESARQADTRRPGQDQYQLADEAWVRLVGYAISAVASMLVLVIALGPSLGWVDGTAHLPWWTMAGIGIALLLNLPAIGAFSQARKEQPSEGPAVPPAGGSRYAWRMLVPAGLAAAIGIVALWHSTVNIFAIAQALLLTAFAAQNILGNGAWLHAKRVSRAAWWAAAVSCMSDAILIYWSLTVAVRPNGFPAPVGDSLLAWLASVVLVIIVTEVTGCAVYVAGQQPYHTDYPPANNCAQDNFLLTCMWLVMAWVPQIVFAHIPAGAPERLAAIGTILAGFLLLFGPAFLWTLENNDTHVVRQFRVRQAAQTPALDQLTKAESSTDRIATLLPRIREYYRSVRHPSNPDEQLSQSDFLVRLSGHTAIQNAVALTLAAITIIGIIGISTGLTPTASGLASLPPEVGL
jgi:hypothetical protein